MSWELPDTAADVDKVQIGEIALSYRKADGGGRHYLQRGHSEEYVSPFYPALRRALAPDACIDIGANYGYTGLLMRRAFSDAHLTLVEPVPWLEAYIRYNFAQNEVVFDRLHSAICSVPTKGDTSTFGVRDTGSQDSRVIVQPGTRTIETDVVTLESLCAGLTPEQGVYIKIDTQGWEEQVFAGGADFLGRHGKWFIKTEFAPDWLESQGSDPVALLADLLGRYSVHESAGRVRWNARNLSDVIGAPLDADCAEAFVAYTRKLALNGLGWVDLYVLPQFGWRVYDTS